LIAQVYSRLVASEVKLVLLAQYPADHRVVLIDSAGSDAARVEHLLLEDMDRHDRFTHASSIYVPPLAAPSSFESFQETIAHLRAPEGCPWDREQTHESLRPHLLEEAYETLESIDRGNPGDLKEELGDLLLQIVLHAQIASEAGAFSMADVIAAIQEKIVRRHPHVFGGLEVEGVEQVLHNWEGLKAGERERSGEGRGALDGVPATLPALSQALEIQGRAARLGFDWRSVDGVRRKIDEELAELDGASRTDDREAEVGDLLFAVVNLARWLEVDPESALRGCNRRFRSRFGWMEVEAAARGTSLGSLDADRLDELWEEAKRAVEP
jgi:tetrapyrrole methylase family protein/MazG family protein